MCVFGNKTNYLRILGVILYIDMPYVFKKKTLEITNIFETTKPVAVSTYESIWQPCTKNRNPAASSTTGQCVSDHSGWITMACWKIHHLQMIFPLKTWKPLETHRFQWLKSWKIYHEILENLHFSIYRPRLIPKG
jgi:hypothetical protein